MHTPTCSPTFPRPACQASWLFWFTGEERARAPESALVLKKRSDLKAASFHLKMTLRAHYFIPPGFCFLQIPANNSPGFPGWLRKSSKIKLPVCKGSINVSYYLVWLLWYYGLLLFLLYRTVHAGLVQLPEPGLPESDSGSIISQAGFVLLGLALFANWHTVWIYVCVRSVNTCKGWGMLLGSYRRAEPGIVVHASSHSTRRQRQCQG